MRPRPRLAASRGASVYVERGDGRLIEAADLAKLEALDDVIFTALAGDAEALDRAATLWRRLRRQAPGELIDESRRQYLRQAETVLARSRQTPREGLGKAFAALEVLALLVE